jgi:hypothetical protein
VLKILGGVAGWAELVVPASNASWPEPGEEIGLRVVLTGVGR